VSWRLEGAGGTTTVLSGTIHAMGPQSMNNNYNNHGVTLLALALLIDALNPSPRVAKSKAAILDNLMLANRRSPARRSP
jgi:hypothetical protein